MAVSLPHLRFAIGGSGERSWSESARIPPQPHRPSLLSDALLLRKQVNHRMGCRGIHLGGIGAWERAHVAGELDHSPLHPVAVAQERDALFSRKADRFHLSLDPPRAEPRAHQD